MSGRRKHKEEEENQERWLLTYADMITLLVAFFMMMYSMSVLNLEKFKKAAIGIRSGFNGKVVSGKETGESMIEKSEQKALRPEMIMLLAPPAQANKPKKIEKGNQIGTAQKEPELKKETSIIGVRPGTPDAGLTRSERVRELVAKLTKSMQSVPFSKNQSVRIIPEKKGVAIELIGDMIFFPKTSANLTPEAKKILKSIVALLKPLPNDLCIEGHTSQYQMESNPQFSNSWELSTARAISVVNFMVGQDQLQPERISVMGYGQYKSPEAKAVARQAKLVTSNDRVRVFIYQE